MVFANGVPQVVQWDTGSGVILCPEPVPRNISLKMGIISKSLKFATDYNWCGPGTDIWFNGQGWYSMGQPPGPPINNLDACCQRHDYQYAKHLYETGQDLADLTKPTWHQFYDTSICSCTTHYQKEDPAMALAIMTAFRTKYLAAKAFGNLVQLPNRLQIAGKRGRDESKQITNRNKKRRISQIKRRSTLSFHQMKRRYNRRYKKYNKRRFKRRRYGYKIKKRFHRSRRGRGRSTFKKKVVKTILNVINPPRDTMINNFVTIDADFLKDFTPYNVHPFWLDVSQQIYAVTNGWYATGNIPAYYSTNLWNPFMRKGKENLAKELQTTSDTNTNLMGTAFPQMYGQSFWLKRRFMSFKITVTSRSPVYITIYYLKCRRPTATAPMTQMQYDLAAMVNSTVTSQTGSTYNQQYWDNEYRYNYDDVKEVPLGGQQSYAERASHIDYRGGYFEKGFTGGTDRDPLFTGNWHFYGTMNKTIKLKELKIFSKYWKVIKVKKAVFINELPLMFGYKKKNWHLFKVEDYAESMVQNQQALGTVWNYKKGDVAILCKFMGELCANQHSETEQGKAAYSGFDINLEQQFGGMGCARLYNNRETHRHITQTRNMGTNPKIMGITETLQAADDV